MFHISRERDRCRARAGSGQNVPNWNQRAFSSRHSSSGFRRLLVRRERGGCIVKPPVSVVQYGMPEIEKPRPAGICLRSVAQLDVMSPDQ